MSTRSASPANTPRNESEPRKILVWDVPVRVFHWLMVLSFAGAYITAESEQWRLLHVTLGYTMAGLVVFRILWGLIGTRYARFSSFIRGPKAVARYVAAMLRKQPEHYVGHNPAGALAIVAMLGLTLVIAATGWALYNDIGGEWLEEAHEVAANVMLAVVFIHIAGVLAVSWLHRENLVRAMFSGRKTGTPDQEVRSPWRSVAVLILVAVLGFWWLQWQGAPSNTATLDRPAASKTAGDHDRDDD